MLTSELDYHLPPELIAQHPVTPRDHSRLLVWDRATGVSSHQRLPGLLAHLHAGDILVYNDSRVIRARVFAARRTGGRVELLFLRRRAPALWEALAKPSGRLQEGEELSLSLGPGPDAGQTDVEAVTRAAPAPAVFRLQEHLDAGRWLVKNLSNVPTEELLETSGEMPLPPYIREELADPERYQTVYAVAPGSAAAPTAGLHFTPELIERIRAMGVGLFPVTLHVGLDTFRPVAETDLGLHRIHSEHYSMPPETFKAVGAARERGGRVVAVGTTSVRVLETVFADPPGAVAGETEIFITPGHRFRAVDALLTNFHLPRSTLLALVMAFAGTDETRRLYQEAIRERYRFYSFGDAMLLR
ncbi:MAG: tRNA preQ1(34) S-adenosylmethionine ribosyltransferase-isomerase QueA [Thermoleophilia bacterium]